MTAMFTKPWRIDRRGERIYIDAPGEVCVDITSGAPEDRARVMALLEQAQPAVSLLLIIRNTLVEQGASGASITALDKVLRAAGVLDE